MLTSEKDKAIIKQLLARRKAQQDAEREAAEEDGICVYCSGSGEGQYDGTTCRSCKGSGVQRYSSES